MRHLNRLIILSALSSFSFVACGNDDDNSGNNGGSGGTGTGGNGTGASTATGGNNMGGDGGGDARACTSTTVAEGILDSLGNGGAPAAGTQLIDDFEAQEENEASWLRVVDGRDGYWVSATYLTPASDMNGPATDPEIDEDEDNNYLVLECEDDDDAEDAACNTTWSASTNRYQWAASSALFVNDDGVPCYDASVFDGIQFSARGGVAGEKIRLQFNTPSDMREQNNSFNSQEIELTTEWKTYTVSFDEVKLEDGGDLVDPKELESVSFVVRNVKSEKDGAIDGESLMPYEVHLDNLAFYIE
jgi:hypothetical protein